MKMKVRCLEWYLNYISVPLCRCVSSMLRPFILKIQKPITDVAQRYAWWILFISFIALRIWKKELLWVIGLESVFRCRSVHSYIQLKERKKYTDSCWWFEGGVGMHVFLIENRKPISESQKPLKQCPVTASCSSTHSSADLWSSFRPNSPIDALLCALEPKLLTNRNDPVFCLSLEPWSDEALESYHPSVQVPSRFQSLGFMTFYCLIQSHCCHQTDSQHLAEPTVHRSRWRTHKVREYLGNTADHSAAKEPHISLRSRWMPGTYWIYICQVAWTTAPEWCCCLLDEHVNSNNTPDLWVLKNMCWGFS